MADSETTNDDVSTPPVVLCCAAADEATARSAADALLGRGHDVELIIGVDKGHAELQTVIARLSAQGLYVLCRSSAMPRSTIDELRAVLRSHEVPFGRTLTLAVEAKRPRALEERVVSVLRRMVTGRPDKGSKRPTQSLVSKPDAPAPSKAVAPPPRSTPEPAEPGADDAVDADEIAAWADSLVGEVPSLGLDPDESSEPLPGEPEVARASAPTKRLDTFSAPAPDYQPVLHTQVSAEEAPVRDGNTAKHVALTPSDVAPPIAPLPAAVPAAAPPAVAPSVVPSSPAMPGASSPSLSGGLPPSLSSPGSGAADDDDLDEALSVGGSFSRALGGPRGMMLVLGGAGILVVLAVIAVVATGDSTQDASKVAASDKAADKTGDKAADKAGDKAADKAGEKAGDKTGDAADPKPEDDGSEPVGDADAGDDAPADGADGDAPSADDGDAPPSGDGEPASDDGDAAGDDGTIAAAISPPPREAPPANHYEAPPEPPPPPDDPVPNGTGDAPEVARALRDREVRALDLFVVAPEDSDPMTHTAAVAYCEGMNIAGLTGWRMPMLGELNSISTGGLTSKSLYWSDTLGDAFGDTRILLNAKKKRMGAATVGFDGAVVLCIRDRR